MVLTGPRRLLPCLLLALVSGACAHGRSAGPTAVGELRKAGFLVHPDLEEAPEPVARSWAAYALGRLMGRERLLEDTDATVPYVEEWLGRQALAQAWAGEQERDEDLSDPYLDALVRVMGAGYLEAYTVFFFAHPGWTLPGAREMELAEFLRWAREHLGAHEPQTLAAPRDDPDAPPPPLLGEGLAPEVGAVDADDPDCDTLVAALPTAVIHWDEAIVGVRERIVAPLDRDELMRTLLRLRPDGADEGRWVAWADPRVARLFLAGAVCAQRLDDATRARAYAQTVVALRPLSVRARRELAHALRMAGERESALRVVERALEITDDPCDRAAVLRQKGDVLTDLDRPEAARQAYLESLEIQPGHGAARRRVRSLDGRLGEESALPDAGGGACTP